MPGAQRGHLHRRPGQGQGPWPLAEDRQLRANIRLLYRPGEREVKAWVYTGLEYGLCLNEGTGIYGPRGTPIPHVGLCFMLFDGRK